MTTPKTAGADNARIVLGLINLGIVGLGTYGFCDCSRATSKHSEPAPDTSAVTGETASPRPSEPTGLPEETVRRELGKMTAFFKWISRAHGAIAKQKYSTRPECEKGRCRATWEGPESQLYFVDWAKKNEQAQLFQTSFGPVKVACGDIDGQPVRTWTYASARKVLCKENSGGNVLIEMHGGAVPTTKFLVYTDAYLTVDPAFAAVVQNEGKAR